MSESPRLDHEEGVASDTSPEADRTETETPSSEGTEAGATATVPGDESEATAEEGSERERETAPPEREPPPPPQEVAETAKEFLTGLLEVMGLEAEITTSVSDSGATLDVSGEAMGALIGRRGQTLDALQEVTRTAVQRRLRARVRLVVDVEGYRARRRDSLADYARSMAERARARGTEIELEPMSAYERKVVHDAVGETEGASSFSEGEEPNRKVIIRGE
ncbi:MAG: RNA-binding cell elongation regulator Jag/EloR [Actinomycetota bacterium]